MSWIESRALEPYPFSVAFARPLGDRLGFTALPEVAHLAFASCVTSFILQRLSARISPKIFRSYYPTNRLKKDDWDLHMARRSAEEQFHGWTQADILHGSDRSDGRTRS